MLAWLLVAASATQASPAPSAESVGQAYYLYVQGRTLDDGNDLPGAEAKYREALALLPNAAELHAELAGVYAEEGKLDDAQAEATKGLSLDADNRSAHRVLGLVQATTAQRTTPEDARRAQLASAASHLTRAVAGGVHDPLVQLTLGDVYVQAEDYAKAIDVLKQFLIDRPGYPQAVMLLVRAYRGAGQPDEATSLLDALRREDATSPAARVREIEQLERRGAWTDAASAWADLLAGDPQNLAYRLRYATALVNGGDVDAGRRVLTDVTQESPKESGAWYLLAQVEERAGHLDAAEHAAQQVVDLDRTDPRGPIALADVRAARHDYRGVVSVLEPRVAAATDADVASGAYAQMANTLGDAWVELGDRRQATQVMESARKRAPKDRQIAFSLAATYEKTQQYDRAERAFRDLIAEDPTHAPALNYLGYMLADRGRKLDEAVSFIQKALAIDADNPSYLDSLGWAYFKQDKLDQAAPPLERAAAAMPDSSVIQEHLGDLYLKTKHYTEAAAAFDRALAGDRDGLDAAAVTKKRDRARQLAGGR